MATLEQLKRDNERLKNELKAKKELLDIQRQRTQLEKENARLIRQQKFGPLIKAGQTTGKVALISGKKIGKFGFKLAKQIAENQKRAAMLDRKAQRVKTKKVTKKKKTRKR